MRTIFEVIKELFSNFNGFSFVLGLFAMTLFFALMVWIINGNEREKKDWQDYNND